ncbi:MAG TPA: NAD(P)/FAD-dependent oxidoreductase [Candidatus Sulfotelmatobacter sp.]|jgi:glycerol-3-phosphate dehydrogenase|nr:NAD(P)/FAD-dependent oxidoreductase [Candidatus Sulfotelmatobacter sp.]
MAAFSRQAIDGVFDACIIGGGVVGCAMARRLTLEGLRVILLERAPDILAGASKANSAILHTGFDAPPGSVELACMQAGYAEYLTLMEPMNLPLLRTGALVVAWTEQEEQALDAILAQAHLNGVSETRRLDMHELRRRAPHLAHHALGAVEVPEEHLIDPWSAPLGYLRQAVDNGAQALFRAEVSGGHFNGDTWTLDTSCGPIHAAMVVNCAGLFGDRIEEALLGASDFHIRPRKGQFVVFDKAAAEYVGPILLPVPSAHTKGIVVTRTVFGNVLVGPTAEEQDDRLHAAVDGDTLHLLAARLVEMVPALAGMPVTATYAGLRPATEKKEYRIHHHADRNMVTVGGIRSTGLTAALGIAQHVFKLGWSERAPLTPLSEPICFPMPNLAEHLPRPWQGESCGEIVCHCERVTRNEIEAALAGPLAAGNLGGLKRRTRACMGRCQGFYCTARVAELAQGRLDIPLAEEPRS